MSFTDGKPFIATEKHCAMRWGSVAGDGFFRCTICDHLFVPGETVRWQFTNDVKGAGGNPLVCVQCDGTKEEIVEKMKTLHQMIARFGRRDRR